MEVERELFYRGRNAYVLDGDNVRLGLCRDLGFSPEDRHENIRRVGEVAALFADSGTIAIVAFISPYRADREMARAAAGDGFHEIYIKADVATCEARDPKGHYRKARAGELANFTGITGEYEEPLAPDLVVDTSRTTVEAAVDAVLAYVEERIVGRIDEEPTRRGASTAS
jgi:bifunctional enzyme CysN/CysC